MPNISYPRRTAVFAALGLTIACGGRPQPALAPQPQVPVVVAATPTPLPAVPVDPVADRIARAQEAFDAGESQRRQGHLGEAKRLFDAAVDVLLDGTPGVRDDARLLEAFTQLSDRITALELAAMATGDGFTEQAYEPASIDELLSDSTLLDLSDAATPGLAAAVEADLGSTSHDIEIPPHSKVLSYIELFRGRLREWFQTSLNRGLRYLPMIQTVFKAEGIPLDLAFVPLIESAFKANALSRARAKGFWQFMSGTGRENGLRVNWYVDERADPEKATVAAAKYFKTLADMFDGDWHLALASYNGGPGRVTRALRSSRRTTFWDLAASTRWLPRETREYVPMILAAMVIGRNPAQYGFDVSPVETLSYEKLTITQPVDLRRVAEWTGATIDTIQELNPELRRLVTPAKTPRYELKVPIGTSATLLEKLSQAPVTELATFKWHEVRRGETLSSIAKRYGVRRIDLADANDLGSRSLLKPGMEILIPHAATTTVASGPSRASREAYLVAQRGDAGGKIVYRVRRGDTLGHIAEAFDTTVAAIKGWNNLTSTRLMPGDRLTIFSTRAANTQ